MEHRILTRKISKKEFPELISRISDGYLEYPLYVTLFGNEKNIRDIIYMHTYFRLFPLMDCLYTNDDLSAGLCIVPAGKRKSIKTSLPFLFFPGWVKKLCIKNLNFRLITLIISQMRMQNKLNKNQYDPRKDVYLKAGWMDKSLRTSMMYENVMEEVADIVGYNPRGYFLDTDSRKHIRLYRMNGFDVVAEVEWQGCPHALMNYSADKVEVLLKRIKEY